MNYNLKSSLFWLSVIGHEAASVLSLLETYEKVTGVREQVARKLKLRTGKLDVLKLLDAFDLIRMHKSGANYTVLSFSSSTGVPGWGQFVQQLSKAFSSGGIKKTEAGRMDWPSIFEVVDRSTTKEVSVGLGKLETIEIITHREKKTPVVLVNGNQRPNGTGFSFTEVIRGDFVCVSSHRIGDQVKNEAPKLKIKLTPAIEEQEVDSSMMWQAKEAKNWNANDLSAWIIHRFSEAYGARPPFNSVDVQRRGILTDGVNALARLQRNSDEATFMDAYTHYIDWLAEHKTFDLTLTSTTSHKLMGIYCVEMVKPNKKKSKEESNVPKGQGIKW